MTSRREWPTFGGTLNEGQLNTDCLWCANRSGRPTPTNSRTGSALWLPRKGWCPAYSKASFRSWYLGGERLGDIEGLSAVLTQLGKDPEQVMSAANTEAVRGRYAANTDAARQLGAFGSPTFAVGG